MRAGPLEQLHPPGDRHPGAERVLVRGRDVGGDGTRGEQRGVEAVAVDRHARPRALPRSRTPSRPRRSRGPRGRRWRRRARARPGARAARRRPPARRAGRRARRPPHGCGAGARRARGAAGRGTARRRRRCRAPPTPRRARRGATRPGRPARCRGGPGAGPSGPARRCRGSGPASAPRGVCTWVSGTGRGRAVGAGRDDGSRAGPAHDEPRGGELVVRRDDRARGTGPARPRGPGWRAARRPGAAGRRAARRRPRRRSGGAAGPGPAATSRARSTGRAVRGIPRRYWSCETDGYWISARASSCGGLVPGRRPARPDGARGTTDDAPVGGTREDDAVSGLEMRPGCECCDVDLPADDVGRGRLLVRVHLLCGLRRAPRAHLPELRRRADAAPHPGGRRAAAPPGIHDPRRLGCRVPGARLRRPGAPGRPGRAAGPARRARAVRARGARRPARRGARRHAVDRRRRPPVGGADALRPRRRPRAAARLDRGGGAAPGGRGRAGGAQRHGRRRARRGAHDLRVVGELPLGRHPRRADAARRRRAHDRARADLASG